MCAFVFERAAVTPYSQIYVYLALCDFFQNDRMIYRQSDHAGICP